MTLPEPTERVLRIASVRRAPIGYIVRMKFRGGSWQSEWWPTKRQAFDYLARFIR